MLANVIRKELEQIFCQFDSKLEAADEVRPPLSPRNLWRSSAHMGSPLRVFLRTASRGGGSTPLTEDVPGAVLSEKRGTATGQRPSNNPQASCWGSRMCPLAGDLLPVPWAGAVLGRTFAS